MRKNRVTIEKKFFKNNSVEAQILFKEGGHQGLLKLHVPLEEEGVPVWGKNLGILFETEK